LKSGRQNNDTETGLFEGCLFEEASYLHEVIMNTLFISSLQRIKSTIYLSLFQGVCHYRVAGIFCLVALITGCSTRYQDIPAFWPFQVSERENYGPGRFKTTLLAGQIDRYYRGVVPGPIGVSTFVNIDDLYTSSTFGRMVSEQLMSELAMKGFDVVELRHSDALQFLNASGEFALSRDVRAVRPQRQLAAVVVGTYVVSPDRVYVNARLVQPSTSLVLSVGSVEMGKTKELARLLRGGTTPGALERIPVKNVGYTEGSDFRRQQWMLEESNGWSPSYRGLAPTGRLPNIVEEPAVKKPQVVESEPAVVTEPTSADHNLSIGLGI
jgi:TolB-like protein